MRVASPSSTSKPRDYPDVTADGHSNTEDSGHDLILVLLTPVALSSLQERERERESERESERERERERERENACV